MKFLLDQNISARVARQLQDAGHDAVTARDLSLSRATDEAVISAARADARVLVSADTDFGTILARTRAATPSLILIRRAANERPAEQAELILSNLDVVADDLDAGSIVVLGERTLRVRPLPIA